MLLLFALGCAPPAPVVGPVPVDVALVPGCPSEEDGTLSACQWRRAAWAAQLWHAGVVDHLVPSGAAVHNRYVEADALAAGLEALGVPASAILPEPQALHTDQNVAFALALLDDHPDWRIGVASDPLQAPGCCAMVEAWTGRGCAVLPMDVPLVDARLRAGVPAVRTTPVPADRWLPLDERERRIAALTGRRRANSFVLYLGKALLRPFGLSRPPDLPPSIDTLLTAG